TDYKCWCAAENELAIVQAGTACVLANCGCEVTASEVLPSVEKVCEKVNAS
ncbi:hypothetical protein QBC32DRAFT_223060, partial [Pseudoneurospora amorphoporcata]